VSGLSNQESSWTADAKLLIILDGQGGGRSQDRFATSPIASQGGEDDAMLEGANPTQLEWREEFGSGLFRSCRHDDDKAYNSRLKKKPVADERLSRPHNKVKQVDTRNASLVMVSRLAYRCYQGSRGCLENSK
jgi:hypothetical protein